MKARLLALEALHYINYGGSYKFLRDAATEVLAEASEATKSGENVILLAVLKDYVQNGAKIPAIKVYREIFGTSLLASKRAIEDMMAEKFPRSSV